jgi:hypothetical protein
MKRIFVAAVVAVGAASAGAQTEEHRELGVHEHGFGQLEVAFEGMTVAIELHAPGTDIVGFEHHPETAEDKAAVDRAVATLATPLNLFVLPAEAGCSVTKAEARLVGEEEEHEEGAEVEHANAEHAEEHGDHSEFRASYALTCDDPAAITRIEFAYFTTFPNARELEVDMLTDKGALRFEVERDAPILDLEGMI